ncbi:hypothetical protein V2I01_41775 [Micromonospora sp. BRA006-A]|nr:hypothetical protein [Micromonospora sp. BRA006-A]
MTVDQSRNSSCMSAGTPSRSASTSTGSGSARSVKKSPHPASLRSRSTRTRSRAGARIRGVAAVTEAGVKAPATAPEDLVLGRIGGDKTTRTDGAPMRS